MNLPKNFDALYKVFFAIQQTHFSQLRIFHICVCIGKWLVKYECKIAEIYIWSLKYFSANMYKIVRKDILLQYNWLNNYRCLVPFESTYLDLTNDVNRSVHRISRGYI